MTSEIQKAIAKMQVLKFHTVIENFTPFWKWEYDVLSISKSGMFCEFEVKVSMSDFLVQKEKTKMEWYSSEIVDGIAHDFGRAAQIPNYFSYCCPEGLITENKIPIFAGLYFLSDGELIEVRKPKRIHNHIFEMTRIKDKILRYYSERSYLGGCRMTYENKLSSIIYNEGN